MDAIFTYRHYAEDSRPRLQFPKRTGKRTSYNQWLEYQYALYHDDALPARGADRPTAEVFVNHGRWLWLCPYCLTAVQVSETAGNPDPCCCPACFAQNFIQPLFPTQRAAIEEELLRQPGYRLNAPFRNWEPGWTLEDLQARTAKAQLQLDQGATFVRAASIATPRTWSVGEVLSAANMNTYIREIQKDLIGTNGAIELLHGVRPGSFSTSQIQALTGLEDGTLLYNSTTQRHEYFVGGNRRGFAGVHASGLFAAGEVVTVTHGLGFAPRRFQLVYERVAASSEAGHGNGDQVYVGQNEAAQRPGWTVFDVTSTQYKVTMVARRKAIMWAMTRGTEMHKINPEIPNSAQGGFGVAGDWPTDFGIGQGLAYLDNAFWSVEPTFTGELWKSDPNDFGRTDGGFGSQGFFPANRRPSSLFTFDGALYSFTGNDDIIKIDHTDPNNESGDFWTNVSLPSNTGHGKRGAFEYEGSVWMINSNRAIWKFNPAAWDSTANGFGLQGTVLSAISSPRGLGAFDNALWTIDNNTDEVYKIDFDNFLNELDGYGPQGVYFNSSQNFEGMVLLEGDLDRTAYITAASGANAGLAAEISVDNDAAAGGWGARMLAFA